MRTIHGKDKDGKIIRIEYSDMRDMEKKIVKAKIIKIMDTIPDTDRMIHDNEIIKR